MNHSTSKNPFRVRWLATVLLLLLLDLGTYLAFRKTESQPAFDQQDKLLHALAFFGYYILGHVSLHFDLFPKVRKRFILVAVNWILWIGYAVFIEAVQKFLTYRSASLGDLLADLLGILVGAAVATGARLYPRSAPSS